jgi:hypothetical protein
LGPAYSGPLCPLALDTFEKYRLHGTYFLIDHYRMHVSKKVTRKYILSRNKFPIYAAISSICLLANANLIKKKFLAGSVLNRKNFIKLV